MIHCVEKWDFITDALYKLDVDQTVDHVEYFPFDDFLFDLVLTFSRDPKFLELPDLTVTTAPLSQTKYTQSTNSQQKINNNDINNNLNILDSQQTNLQKNITSPTNNVANPTQIPPNNVVPFHQQVTLQTLIHLCL